MVNSYSLALYCFQAKTSLLYGQITSHHLHDSRQNILDETVATITRWCSKNKKTGKDLSEIITHAKDD